jgi:8-oxo-dGTP pyrophosphatase MutT (NUDIX family)
MTAIDPIDAIDAIDAIAAIDTLRAAFADSPPRTGSLSGEPLRASVCIIVAGSGSSTSICLIRRAAWPGDPWSEHIALPGGRRNGDETPAATVVRELQEEVGLAVPHTELVQLPQLGVRLAGRERLLLLDAFVYFAGASAPPLQPGPEIDLAFWAPIATLWDLDAATCNILDDAGETLVYPAIRVPQGVIFGITLRVLVLLSDRAGIPIPMLEEIPLLRRAPPR